MSDSIVQRKLIFAPVGSATRNEFVVQIHQPYLVTQDMVDFRVAEGTAACKVIMQGLAEEFSEVVYGADLLQALQLAVDIEPILKRLSKRYNFYFTTGEPYSEKAAGNT